MIYSNTLLNSKCVYVWPMNLPNNFQGEKHRMSGLVRVGDENGQTYKYNVLYPHRNNFHARPYAL